MIPRSASRTEVIVALTPRSCQARFHRRGDVDCALMAFVDSTIANCSREMPMDGEFLATQADDVPVARDERSQSIRTAWHSSLRGSLVSALLHSFSNK